MAWLQRLLKRSAKSSLAGLEYRTAFNLYSLDGKREAEVIEFRDGRVFLLERERADGTTFKDRHSGRPVGPFSSPQEAEKFIVGTAWFTGSAE